MMLGRLGFGALYFFILQSWAITLEIVVRSLVTGSTRSCIANGSAEGKGKEKKEPEMIWRVLGYIWVLSWFVAVGPLIQQPMIDAGVFTNNGFEELKVTRMVGRWLALDVI
jgi:hypothetical protein